MPTIFFVVFVCSVMYGTALEDNESIIYKISQDNVCNNKEVLFGNFNLSQVSQFDALCNLPIPNYSEVDILLQDNMIPILCMGVYDVSIRLCKSALHDVRPFQDIFPPSTAKFKSIFSMLEKNNPSLKKFCSHTVKNQTIQDSSSEITKDWWVELNKKFNNEDKCLTTCQTNEKNQVHPLCLFIIWANGLFKNFLNNQEEIQHTAQTVPIVADPNILDGREQVIDGNSNQLGSPGDNKEQLISTTVAKTVVESSNNTELVQNQLVSQRGKPVIETIKTAIELTSAPENNSSVPEKQQKDPVLESVAVAKSMKVNPNDTSVSRNGQMETNPAGYPQGKDVKKDKSNKEHSVKKNKNDKAKVQPKDTSVKENVGSPDMTIVASESKDLTQPKTENNAYNTQDNEVSSFGSLPNEDLAEANENNEEPSSDPGFNGEDGDRSVEQHVAINEIPDETKTESVIKPEATKIEGVKTETRVKDPFSEAEDSHFFTYFLCMSVLTILTYVAFHNKKKLVALALEGRKKRGSRRRPNCSNYRKLDCSLEEAMVSKSAASVTHVLY